MAASDHLSPEQFPQQLKFDLGDTKKKAPPRPPGQPSPWDVPEREYRRNRRMEMGLGTWNH